MLSSTSRQEILRRLGAKLGYPIDESSLSPSTRQTISNLSAIQRHLLVTSEIHKGERSRVEKNALLSLSSRLHKDKEREEYTYEIRQLQSEIESKITEVSTHILQEDIARQSGQPPPERQGAVEAVQLKCPNCGANLPMPIGPFVECKYCNATFSIQDVSSQIRTMIQGI
jgi:hypothetical protein